MAGFFLLYVLIFKDIYEEDTNEKMSILARILFFVFMDVPFLFISYAIISGYLRILNDLIYPNSFKIDINSKLCIYESSRQKVKISFESDCFKKICYDLISVDRGEDDDYYLKSWIEGDNTIIYFTDRSNTFDILDLKYVSNYLQIPLLKNDTSYMQLREYEEFRKQELDNLKKDPRQKYYL